MDNAEIHNTAWEDALDEAMSRFEQGEELNNQQFEELVAELEARVRQAEEMQKDDPRTQKIEALRERAAKLAQSAALGTGPTDQVSSVLAGLTGSNATAEPKA